jgi:hypothetical protein
MLHASADARTRANRRMTPSVQSPKRFLPNAARRGLLVLRWDREGMAWRAGVAIRDGVNLIHGPVSAIRDGANLIHGPVSAIRDGVNLIMDT